MSIVLGMVVFMNIVLGVSRGQMNEYCSLDGCFYEYCSRDGCFYDYCSRDGCFYDYFLGMVVSMSIVLGTVVLKDCCLPDLRNGWWFF